MRKIEIIHHKGIDIVYQDFSNLKKAEEIKAVVDSGIAYIRKQVPKSVVTLSNMDGMYFNNDLFNYFASAVKGNDPYVISSAVFGLNGLISIMYNGFVKLTGRQVKSCKSKEEALDYLCEKVGMAKKFV
jgi:vesicle coat complex subunit